MAATRVLDARTVGTRFAELVKGDPDVRELWVSNVCGHAKLYVVTRPLGVEEGSRFYRALIALRDHLGTYVDIRVLDSSNFVDEEDLRLEIPRDAAPISLC